MPIRSHGITWIMHIQTHICMYLYVYIIYTQHTEFRMAVPLAKTQTSQRFLASFQFMSAGSF